MDQDWYDEFGNYIGPEVEESSEESEENDQDFTPSSPQLDKVTEENIEAEATQSFETQIVLAEDKKYYPTPMEVYGEEVETIVQEEDTQPLSQPIIEPVRMKLFERVEREIPKTTYKKEYLANIAGNAALVRNVAVVGHLHHGKTSLLDTLISQTHEIQWKDKQGRPLKYTDTRKDEVERAISLKATPMTILLPTMTGKNYAVHFMDVPGHVNFFDEVVTSLRIADGILLVVDVVEGLMSGTELVLKHALMEGLTITLVLNKIDRLILELRLPPSDAYFKILHTLDDINATIHKCVEQFRLENFPILSPERGNVAFASALQGWSFTLAQFANHYLMEYPECPLSLEALVSRLWGDIYYDKESRKFVREPPPSQDEEVFRTFVSFILEPLYKLTSAVVSYKVEDLKKTLQSLGLHLKNKEYMLDVKPLLQHCLSSFMGPSTGLVSMLVDCIPSPLYSTKHKVQSFYTGPMDSEIVEYMMNCDSQGPLVIMVVKLIPNPSFERFYALGRIMSGRIQPGQKVRILGDNYDPEYDDEDQAEDRISHIYIPGGRYKLEVTAAYAGSWILVEGIDDSIFKSATVIASEYESWKDMHIFQPVTSILGTGVSCPVVRVAIEPLKPSELPKMVDGLRKCNKSYPALQTKVEESGEHVILGTGELYLDCVLYDLRTTFAEIEVKVSDPSVPFSETVSDTSSIKCFAETSNKKNKITMIAEPLESGLAEEIESGSFSLEDHREWFEKVVREKYDWDILAARGLWTFGPSSLRGPNCLLDDTLPGGDTDKSLLYQVRDSFIQGFQWAVREGPLCDEPVRGVKFRLLQALIANDLVARNPAQLIPATRRVCYSSMLTASPRLMEPVYSVEIICPADCVAAVYTLLARRRGHVTEDAPKPASPLFTLKAFIPVLDSFGFEVDLRTFTQGQAFCLSMFDHWEMMPGDPLDQNIVLKPLEPSPASALARECLVKTRRRKGLSEDVSIVKYFDDPWLLELVRTKLENTE
ncbi:hypothetical protein GpartN1_g7160.t1 [Galdieria partita]|uniref:116 kDa U5 small nuclear ribonucleoprotein component n=1 Tax=Galdieria partita TaxID=83374 RepID=A0A9C7UTJ8_9RHOD|nr:hypothetical protein GpartN1_g7160.t1 [Galdieria partita]